MRTITSMNRGWRFARLAQPCTEPPTLPADEMQPVDVPHVWNIDNPAASGCCLYETEFACKEAVACTFLAFDAVWGAARVFLNGEFLGEHRGSYSRFVFEATGRLKPVNTLQVLADNTRFDDINPLTGDFTYWGGIPRGVSRITTDAAHFDLISFGTPGLEILRASADGTLCVNAPVCGAPDAQVEYIVVDEQGMICARCTCPASDARAELAVKEPHLWNGKSDPYLYRCIARLWSEGRHCDEVSLPFGFRDAALDAENGFCLNGKPMRLNGVARHNDREGAGCAPSAEQIEEDFALIREIGANAVRLSHYQHPQDVYDCCDRDGLVTWAEIPMLSMPDGNAGVLENACAQLAELIVQNRHHPSICFWGVQNEIAMMGESLEMYDGVKKLHDLARRLDENRITTAANLYSVRNNSQLNFITDAVGYNIYFGWYYGEMQDYSEFFRRFHAENPGVALCVSEYGVDCNMQFHSEKPECKD